MLTSPHLASAAAHRFTDSYVGVLGLASACSGSETSNTGTIAGNSGVESQALAPSRSLVMDYASGLEPTLGKAIALSNNGVPCNNS